MEGGEKDVALEVFAPLVIAYVHAILAFIFFYHAEVYECHVERAGVTIDRPLVNHNILWLEIVVGIPGLVYAFIGSKQLLCDAQGVHYGNDPILRVDVLFEVHFILWHDIKSGKLHLLLFF